MDPYDNICESGVENNLWTFKHNAEIKYKSLKNYAKKFAHNWFSGNTSKS